jgi:class 3 adenylate cyclase/tetratricopeptide (TPR) repeat protein
MQCPQCQQQSPPDADFCPECGAKLSVVCAGCGTANAPMHKFCKKCGQALSSVVGAAQPDNPAKSVSSYTPKHLAEKILTSKAALEGERKQVTVLFADLKGSMELLADRDPEEARTLLDPVLEHMMEAVHRYEGTVNQVMGDGTMALFGAPLALEDHAVRACYAALRMQESVKRYSETVRRSHGIEVQIRVGLNSGDVVVRSIGSDLRMDYTAVGQTTHLAARMEQLATPGTIRLTAETLHLAEGFVQATPLGPIPVKGLADPVEIFELTGAAAGRTRLQAARARGFTRFVGRDSELEELRRAADQAGRGRGQVVAVVGDPGVGKSRLFFEFIHSHRTHAWRVLESSSVSYGKATPFLPIADLLRGYFRIDDRDDTRGVRAKVMGTLLTLDSALEDAVPAVMWLLDALGPDDAFLALNPSQRRQRALDGVRRLLLRESRVQPLLLVFEDLHWIDAETQALLDSLVDSLPTAPALLAVNYRPEYRHAWGSKTYYRQLRIDPLAPESADQLLSTLLGDNPSVRALTPLLIDRTEGNPLFLEESVRTLVETHVLVGEAGAYRLAKPVEAIQVPATVQAILAARIDRLHPGLKWLLQAASVVGKDVPVALLEAIADMTEDELRRALAALQTAEFLYEARLFPDLEYTFKHALTHEVAYGTVLHDRRRALHAAIVSAIERLYADRLAEQVEVLAHHALRGHALDKAVRYLHQAGVKAVARSANREAIALFEQGLAIVDQLPETVEIMREALDIRIALGPALIAVKGAATSEVEALYRRALDLVDRLGDGSRRFPALWGLWFVNYTRGRYAAALEAGERLLEAAQSGNDTGQLLEAYHALWPTLSAMGQPTAAIVPMERGLALYDRTRHASQAFFYGGHDPGTCCRYHLALTHWLLGHPDRALAALHDALRLAEELNHPLSMTITLWIACWVHYHRRDRETTAATADRLLALTSQYGFATWSDAGSVLSPLMRGTRLSLEALDELHSQVVKGVSAAWRRVFCLCALAELYAESGHDAAARQVLASITAEDRRAFYAPEVYRIEGELLRRSQPTAIEAEQSFQTSLTLARRRGEKSFELRAAMSLARVWRERGKREEGRVVLAETYGRFTEGFDTPDLSDAKKLLDELSVSST